MQMGRRKICARGVYRPLLAALLLALCAPQARAVTVLTPPRPVEQMKLTDQHGALVTADSLAGRWTVLFFGFTHCPDVCPTTLARLAGVQRRLPDAIRPKVRFMLVSVDPMRDTPKRLAEYVGQFGQNFVGATAPLSDLAPLLKELGVSYAYTAEQANPHADHAGHDAHAGLTMPPYTVTHSETLYVLDPQARLYAVFTDPKDDYALQRELIGWIR
jgi:protein SCO1/2